MAAQKTEQPWVLDTRELIRRPGSMLEVRRVVTTKETIGTDVIAVPTGQPVELDVRLESVVEGVLATGTVQAVATGVCVRCLDEVEESLEVSFQELFAYPERAAHHQKVAGAQENDPEEEQRELDGDLMDLEETVRDAVVTALPFQPVCRDDCPGLCSECGARLADDPEHHHDVIDPRWAALAEMATPSDDDERRT